MTFPEEMLDDESCSLPTVATYLDFCFARLLEAEITFDFMGLMLYTADRLTAAPTPLVCVQVVDTIYDSPPNKSGDLRATTSQRR